MNTLEGHTSSPTHKYKVGDTVIYITPTGVNMGKRTIFELDDGSSTHSRGPCYDILPASPMSWLRVSEDYLHEPTPNDDLVQMITFDQE